jgi:argininosuccinate lyase
MHATPFANSVAVGTEGCAGAVEALDAAADSVTLLRLVVAGAKPRPDAMLARTIAGQTTATAAAERLVAEGGLSFREAHYRVGQLLTDADGDLRSSGTPAVPQERRTEQDGLDPVAVVRSARFGGGPGAPVAVDDLRQRRAAIAGGLAQRVGRWRGAELELGAVVAELTEAQPAAVFARTGRTA